MQPSISHRPRRGIHQLADAARGRRLRRSIYMNLVDIPTGDFISDLTASRDLTAMVDAGVLELRGAGRGRVYCGCEELRELWLDVRSSRPPRREADPYVTLAQSGPTPQETSLRSSGWNSTTID